VNVDSSFERKTSNPGLAIGLILLSALATTSGQLFWKLGTSHRWRVDQSELDPGSR
jgi:hypothetical protein